MRKFLVYPLILILFFGTTVHADEIEEDAAVEENEKNSDPLSEEKEIEKAIEEETEQIEVLPITNLQAVAGKKTIDLFWESPKVEHSYSVLVFMNGDLKKIVDEEYSHTSFHDLDENTSYNFGLYVLYRDYAKYSEVTSVVVETKELEADSILPPDGLKVSFVENKVHVTWKKNREAKSYVLYVNGEKIDSLIYENYYSMTLEDDMKYEFQVSSVSFDDEESDLSSPTSISIDQIKEVDFSNKKDMEEINSSVSSFSSKFWLLICFVVSIPITYQFSFFIRKLFLEWF